MARLLGSEGWFKSLWERARREGMTGEEARTLADFEAGPFGPREKAALRYCKRITTDYLAVDEELFGDLKRHFSDPELIELGLFVGMMNGTLKLSHSLGIGALPGAEGDERRPGP